ncbi:MAG: hypothetical protein JSW67_09500 [Candidatus Latescibacterota bacterium]|nr:MAG: hypothetical protein JSW67_09500 [Candidatus Latescibacterota bacterium]
MKPLLATRGVALAPRSAGRRRNAPGLRGELPGTATHAAPGQQLEWARAQLRLPEHGGVRFADVSAASGLDFNDDARAIASVDWDSDGDLDLWISNRTGPRVRFVRNANRTRNHFLALRLVGSQSNRDAIGARLELHLGNGKGVQLRSLRAGRFDEAAAAAQNAIFLARAAGQTQRAREIEERQRLYRSRRAFLIQERPTP